MLDPMPMRLGTSWLIAGVVLCGCRPAPRAVEFELKEEEWQFDGATGARLTTDHFEIYTTVQDRELREALPLFLETAYALYSELLPAERQRGSQGEGEKPAREQMSNGTGEQGSDAENREAGAEARRLKTFVFNTRGEWDRFTRRTFPRRYPLYARIQNGGFAVGRMCVVYYMRRAHTLSVIAHEGLHQYFGAHFNVQVPAWLNEGLACYCESFDFRDGLPVFVPRQNTFRLNPLRRTLTADAVIPLHDLLATHAGEVIGEGRGALTDAYYAQAWALIVFLRHGQKERYRPGLEKLLADIAGGELHAKAQAARLATGEPSRVSPGEGVFRAYITHDLDAFEAEYRAFMAELAGLR